MEAHKDDLQAIANKLLKDLEEAAYEATKELSYAVMARLVLNTSLQLATTWAIMTLCSEEGVCSEAAKREARDLLNRLPSDYVQANVENLTKTGALKPVPEESQLC
jgi:hypothetical protein